MTDVAVVSEPLTYRAEITVNGRGGVRVRTDTDYSYVQDLVLHERTGDRSALDRLERHGREMDVELRNRPLPDLDGLEFTYEQRTTASSFANPPLWLIDHFATAPRAARVLADLAPNLPLPKGAASVNLPGLTEATSVAMQHKSAALATGGPTDVAITSPVATIAGAWDVPMQLLEQSPQGAHLDWVAFKQMSEDYDAQLEYLLINGNGVGSQFYGLLNNPLVPSSHNIATTATTATTQFSALGQVLAVIGNDRLMPAEAWLLRTNRFAWYGSSEDLQSRPLMLSNRAGDGMFDLLATTVYHDNAIPATLGAGNQDVVIACRPSDWLVLESEHTTDVMEDVLSGTLTARLLLRGYAAALLLRPSSVAYLSGTGMVRPSGF